MAPRANWKGFLRLSLVTCPVALFPATPIPKRSASIRSTGRLVTGSDT
jgi:non-homologous end joining protein Ku